MADSVEMRGPARSFWRGEPPVRQRIADLLFLTTTTNGQIDPAQALQKALVIGDIEAAVLIGKRLLGPIKMRPRPPGYIPAVSGEIIVPTPLSSQTSEPE